MAEVAYRSEVRVERVKGPLRRAYLPAEKEPVLFSTHGPGAAHYKAQPGTYEPHATTLDYVSPRPRVDWPGRSVGRWQRATWIPMESWSRMRLARWSWKAGCW